MTRRPLNSSDNSGGHFPAPPALVVVTKAQLSESVAVLLTPRR